MWGLLWLNVCCISFLFFCLFDSSCLLSFWFISELLSICVVPQFFYWATCSSQRCMFQYVLALMVSSFFIVAGVLFGGVYNIFILVGVFIKLGIYPFISWAYEMVIFGSWSAVWVFSCLLKIPFFFLFYLRGSQLLVWFCLLMSILSFVVLTINFWKVSSSWRHCWCHMMLSSSVGLVVVSVNCSFTVVFMLFLLYLVWSSLVLWYLSIFGYRGIRSFSILGLVLYFFLLISFPVSLAVAYKLVLGASVLLSSFFVFGLWSCYTVSEQLFLLYLLTGSTCVRSLVSLESSI